MRPRNTCSLLRPCEGKLDEHAGSGRLAGTGQIQPPRAQVDGCRKLCDNILQLLHRLCLIFRYVIVTSVSGHVQIYHTVREAAKQEAVEILAGNVQICSYLI